MPLPSSRWILQQTSGCARDRGVSLKSHDHMSPRPGPEDTFLPRQTARRRLMSLLCNVATLGHLQRIRGDVLGYGQVFLIFHERNAVVRGLISLFPCHRD